ncbi:MAG: penicillin-binding protein 2 [Desulfobacteraceae bacterium 4572_88]|nr:MAG: penicillin-binding protein 2 [Desulfobacteraceae bacterium 4572_88]
MNKYLKTADKDWYKQRLTGSMFLVMGAFLILITRLIYLQVLEGDEYRRLSENNCIRLQSINSPRGLIFDRKGNLLVDNRPSFDLSIILKDAKPFERTLEKLSRYINVPVEEFWAKIEGSKGMPSYKPILLRRDIGRDTLAAIEVHRFDLPGVVVDIREKRHYIREQSAAHLTGYLGEINADELKDEKYAECRAGDFVGKFGAEKAFDSFLRGKRGGRQVEVNARGQVVRVLKTVDAEPGHNVYLTIDQTLQEKAELLLEGIAGAVSVADPNTGQVLAMASSPSFDPNAFVSGLSHEDWNTLSSNPFRPMENKVIQGEYPPASTYKIVTAIAGLEERVIDENTSVYCPGHYVYGNRVFRCWKKTGHGTVNVVKALAQSCDVFFYQVGQKLGVDRLAKYAMACGLGERTDISLDHEAKGLIPTSAWKKKRTGIAWQRGETLSVAIGQGYNLTTPLQMLVVISAVANGGTLYHPLILERVETVDGSVVYKSEKQVRGKLPASKRTLDIVKKGLWDVVNGAGGTARVAQVEGLEISGKTGTAQVASRKKNDTRRRKERPPHLRAHAWFVAYAPSDAPQIAVSVIVEHGEHGSGSAAPIARELIKCFMADTHSDSGNAACLSHAQMRFGG